MNKVTNSARINGLLSKFIFLLLVITLVVFPSTVNADVAPPAQPPGASLQPGVDVTEVRMMSETVTIEIQDDAPDNSLGQARVTASFTMRNLGEQVESMEVRFPISTNDGFGNYPLISNITVKVNGSGVDIRQIDGEDPYGYDRLVPWVAFDVTFKPDEDVIILVTYTLEAWGELPFVNFEYIFSTGAAWKGTIGSATLFVRFPYEINPLNLLPFPSDDTPTTHKLSGSELKWVYADFEPSLSDNFSISIVAPSVWQEVLNERQIVSKNPDDGEAWGRLAKLYKELTFSSRRRGFRYGQFSSDEGAQLLFSLSESAYEKAVKIKFYDPLWHAGYADLLGYYACYAKYDGIDTRREAVKALQEIQLALQMAPKDEKVLIIANDLLYYLDGGIVEVNGEFDFPWLTATPGWMTPTPEPTATRTPEITLAATAVSVNFGPTKTAQPMQTALTPEPKKVIPVCGSILLLALGFILFLYRKN
jgi:hypothetical protein